MSADTSPTPATAPTTARPGVKKSSEKNSGRSARRRAREYALQGIYAWLIQQDGSGLDDLGAIEAHLREDEGFDEADSAWFATLLHGVPREAATLRNQLAPHLDRNVQTLSPIEHAVLLMGSFELTHHVEVPYRVVINEAVELTKSFGGTDGFKFVNGVLDKLALKLRSTETGADARV